MHHGPKHSQLWAVSSSLLLTRQNIAKQLSVTSINFFPSWLQLNQLDPNILYYQHWYWFILFYRRIMLETLRNYQALVYHSFFYTWPNCLPGNNSNWILEKNGKGTYNLHWGIKNQRDITKCLEMIVQNTPICPFSGSHPFSIYQVPQAKNHTDILGPSLPLLPNSVCQQVSLALPLNGSFIPLLLFLPTAVHWSKPRHFAHERHNDS